MDEVVAGDLVGSQPYKLLVGSVVPRPIAWIVTSSLDRIDNIAPFSFFTVASPDPPTLCFSISPSSRADWPIKDTLKNLRRSGELTVNIIGSHQLNDFIGAASTVNPEVDEFQVTGLSREASRLVDPPRIRESQVCMECRLDSVVEVGTHSLVLARVLLWRFADGLRDGFRVDMGLLNPLGRLAGPQFSTMHNVVELVAPSPDAAWGEA